MKMMSGPCSEKTLRTGEDRMNWINERVLVTLILFLFITFSVSAESGIISGTVMDKAADIPVPYATVVITELDWIELTDENGSFIIVHKPTCRAETEGECLTDILNISCINDYNLEVIGNIYENKELLDG